MNKNISERSEPRYREVDSCSCSGLGKTIHQHAKSNDCAVVPCFLGHGIGDFFHGPPDIYHSLNNYPGIIDKLTNTSSVINRLIL